jgi:hypothetical protein
MIKTAITLHQLQRVPRNIAWHKAEGRQFEILLMSKSSQTTVGVGQ